ncbi:hypothetical protein RHODOP_03330 [Rhodoplanes sp. P11]|uniref:sensor histidine kinase n=1 Tax=Rhodoplanes TaxID=29407 RepID=UPI00101D1F22|nr:HWE histidine kinase domain-containing protein [Rhodoplanes serenus]
MTAASAGPPDKGEIPSRAPTIRSRLVALVLSTLLPVLIFSGALIVRQAQQERAALELQAEAVAVAAVHLIDAHVRAVEPVLRTLAMQAPRIQEERPAFQQIAAAAAQHLGKSVALLDRTGRPLVVAAPAAEGVVWPQTIDMASLAALTTADGLVVTDLLRDPAGGRSVALVAVATTAGGDTGAILAAVVDPAALGHVLRDAGLPDDWIAAVVDRQGLFVARSHQAETQVGQPARPELAAAASGPARRGRFDNVTWEGVSQHNAFHRSAVTGWTAVIGIPHAVLDAPERRAAAVLATGAVFAALALVLAMFFARRIAAPISALEGAAMALAHGEPLPAGDRRIRELDEVWRAFEGAAAIVRARNAAEEELRRTTALLAAVSASTPDLIYVKDRDGRMVMANEAALAVTGRGRDEVLGRTEAEWHHDPEEAAAIMANDRAVMTAGAASKVEETFTTPPGETRVFLSTKSPLRDAAGTVVGLVGVSTDITERKRREEHVELLMHELSHRTKNLLAVIQALARQLMRTSTDPADFEQKFLARIQALALAHDLLVQQRWQGAQLAEVIGAQLYPFVGGEHARVTLDGPPLMLRLEAVQNLSLVLHELATNAAKYGALSVPAGRVAITWRIDGDALVLDWREHGGPPVQKPERRGFGHTIIERLLAQGMDGSVVLNFPPDGAVAMLRVPVAQMTVS